MTAGDTLERLAAHVANGRYDALPREALTAGKRLLLDTLAVGWAGASAEGLQVLRDRVGAQSGPPCCDVWGTEQRCAMLDAAFLNGISAAALEYDSLHVEALVHADIVSTPALLAAAQVTHASGRDFLAALILANDVSCRLALAASSSHTGWWHTSIYSIFGAAAGSAKLLGLDARGIADAMALALSQTSGTQQAIIERGDTKRMQSAFAARSGLFAAFLASCGATGPRGAFDGPYGLFALYESGQSTRALQDLGSRYEGSFARVKRFPTCACNHALTEAVLQLVEEFDLQPGRIVSATARISPYMHRLVGARYEPDGNPRVAAQFSAQYSVASAVFRRRVGLAELEPIAALEPAVVEFARRVTIEIDPSSDGQLVPAEIELVLSDGRRINRRVETVPSGVGNTPASKGDRRKIVECLERGPRRLAAPEIDRLLSDFDGIEALPDVAKLFDSIRGGPH